VEFSLILLVVSQPWDRKTTISLKDHCRQV